MFTADPDGLIGTKWTTLKQLCEYAVGDATTFHASAAAIQKEQELRGDPGRMQYMKDAEQIAGAKFHYRQNELRQVYNAIIKAQGAICTTFALCAAHILTEGKRQSGNVRVEVVGINRNLGTHLFVIVGRQGNDLHNPNTWGNFCRLVDPWAAAKALDDGFLVTIVSQTDWRVQESAKLTRFYDNTLPDPSEDDRKQEVNTVQLAANLNQTKLNSLQNELNALPPYARQRRSELQQQIADLRGTA